MAWFIPAFIVAVIIDALRGHEPGPITTLTLVAACLAGAVVP